MNRVVVADASPLIVLQNIGELSLLEKLFGVIFITEEVKTEYGLDLPKWIEVVEIQDRTKIMVLDLFLDRGETTAIVLCLERAADLLIIDEKKGRRIARELGLNIIGTLGVIGKAKESGLIHSVGKIVEKLEAANFRLSPSLKSTILEMDAESDEQ